MGSAVEHRKLKNKIRNALAKRRDVAMWSNESGSLQAKDGRWIKYGVGEGGSDLVGLVAPFGTWLGLEVKTGRARQQANQRAHQRCIERYGGFYAVVRSVEDAHRAVDEVVRRTRERQAEAGEAEQDPVES